MSDSKTPKIEWDNVSVRVDRWHKLQQLCEQLEPHEHCDGMNECSICDEPLTDVLIRNCEKLLTMQTELSAIAAAYLEHDAENAALRHDIARAVDTTSALATENEELRRQLKAADRNHLHASQERDAEREALEVAERRVATEQSQKEYLRGCLRDSQEISSSNRKRAESAEARVRQLEAREIGRAGKVALLQDRLAQVEAETIERCKQIAAKHGALSNVTEAIRALSATPKADSAKESAAGQDRHLIPDFLRNQKNLKDELKPAALHSHPLLDTDDGSCEACVTEGKRYEDEAEMPKLRPPKVLRDAALIAPNAAAAQGMPSQDQDSTAEPPPAPTAAPADALLEGMEIAAKICDRVGFGDVTLNEEQHFEWEVCASRIRTERDRLVGEGKEATK